MESIFMDFKDEKCLYTCMCICLYLTTILMSVYFKLNHLNYCERNLLSLLLRIC